MFWQVLKWGGTAVLLAICGFAFYAGTGNGSTEQPSTDQPAPAEQPGKKFNF